LINFENIEKIKNSKKIKNQKIKFLGDMTLRLFIQAGKASPGPPTGPALGQKGLNIMDFCKQVPSIIQSFHL